MDYKVLYRKYRPSSFSKIVGQDYTVNILRNAIKLNKISHAYIFTGPRGTGKTSTAKVFAKTINCEHPVDGEACGQCSSCLGFADNPDIIEIDAASNNGVDDIRELINNVKVAPSQSKYKIYIIDEVHMMTTSAFNALLLTLEEPPKHAVFIMATTNVESVPITILSRCQRFNFQKISLECLKKQISYVCGQENIKITDDAIEEIAYLSEGGMRDALSLLDQLSSQAEEITLDHILSQYGSISSKVIKDLMTLMEEKKIQEIHQLFEQLCNTSSDYKVFLKKIVQELTHMAILIKTGTYKGSFRYDQIKKIIFECNDIMNKININMNPYVLIELILLSSLEISSSVTSVPEIKENSIKEQEKPEVIIQSKEVSTVDNSVTQPENSSNESYFLELKKIRINNCFFGAKKEFLNLYQSIWQNLQKESSISTDFLPFLLDSNIVAASENYCILSTKLLSTANLMNQNLEAFSKEVESFFEKEMRFIALSEEEWLEEKKRYVKNLKEQYIYQFMDEKELENLKPKNDGIVENILSDVFNRDKIEVV